MLKKQVVKMFLAGVLSLPLSTTALASEIQEAAHSLAKTSVTQNAEQKDKKGANSAQAPLPASNVPIKIQVKPPFRLVNPKVQRGEEISRLVADVNGDGQDEVVLLMGSKIAASTNYYGDIYVITKDPKTDKIKNFIRPKNLGGYNAYLFLCEVTGDAHKDLIIAAPTGGSSGVIDYRIIDFAGKEPKEIFGPKENKGISVTGTFLPDFKVRLVLPSIAKELEMELPGDRTSYISLNAYEPNGAVKNSGLRPYGEDLANLVALDVNGDGRDEIITTQKIIGLSNKEALGYVRGKWVYKAGAWVLNKVDFQTTLQLKADFSKEAGVIGKSGYAIKPEQVVVDTSNIQYPHFAKLDKVEAWIINQQLEDYAKNILQTVAGKGETLVRYEVKYAGRNFVSIFFKGNVTKNKKVDKLAEAFNFNLTTGEDLNLNQIVQDEKKFWQKVKEKSSNLNLIVAKKDVYGYYFDGDALVLLYNNGKEFALNASDVTEFLAKGEIKDEFLTKQSNVEKDKKEVKNEEKKEKTS